MTTSTLKEVNQLILSEMFQNSKVNFNNSKEKTDLMNGLNAALKEIDNLHFRNIKIDNDGYILLDIDIEEKNQALGELGYTSTVIWKCSDMSKGQIIERMVHCVLGTFKEELEVWNQAKQIYAERFGSQNLKGRSSAYAYLEIYRDDLKQNF